MTSIVICYCTKKEVTKIKQCYWDLKGSFPEVFTYKKSPHTIGFRIECPGVTVEDMKFRMKRRGIGHVRTEGVDKPVGN